MWIQGVCGGVSGNIHTCNMNTKNIIEFYVRIHLLSKQFKGKSKESIRNVVYLG